MAAVVIYGGGHFLHSANDDVPDSVLIQNASIASEVDFSLPALTNSLNDVPMIFVAHANLHKMRCLTDNSYSFPIRFLSVAR